MKVPTPQNAHRAQHPLIKIQRCLGWTECSSSRPRLPSRQSSTYLQPQPLASRFESSNLLREVGYSTRDKFPSSRSSESSRDRRPSGRHRAGDPSKDRHPSSQQENSGAPWHPSSHHEESHSSSRPPTRNDHHQTGEFQSSRCSWVDQPSRTRTWKAFIDRSMALPQFPLLLHEDLTTPVISLPCAYHAP